jgi:hypothetical protein
MAEEKRIPMNLRRLNTLAVLSLTIPVAVAACGSSGGVGGGTTGPQKGTGGGGGSAVASGGQAGGLGATGGTPGNGGTGTAGGGGGITCGKNTCGAGEYCCDPLCGTCAPKGASCVQGCQVDPPPLPTCASNSDCSVAADYCTGCDCRVLRTGDTLPACNDAGTVCSADPCLNTTAACANGICVAKKSQGADTTCTTNADCIVTADNCTMCTCRALAKSASLPKCSGPGVQCLVDPCMNKTAACVNANCVAR